eukprot:tig00020537_g10223.t1
MCRHLHPAPRCPRPARPRPAAPLERGGAVVWRGPGPLALAGVEEEEAGAAGGGPSALARELHRSSSIATGMRSRGKGAGWGGGGGGAGVEGRLGALQAAVEGLARGQEALHSALRSLTPLPAPGAPSPAPVRTLLPRN